LFVGGDWCGEPWEGARISVRAGWTGCFGAFRPISFVLLGVSTGGPVVATGRSAWQQRSLLPPHLLAFASPQATPASDVRRPLCRDRRGSGGIVSRACLRLVLALRLRGQSPIGARTTACGSRPCRGDDGARDPRLRRYRPWPPSRWRVSIALREAGTRLCGSLWRYLRDLEKNSADDLPANTPGPRRSAHFDPWPAPDWASVRWVSSYRDNLWRQDIATVPLPQCGPPIARLAPLGVALKHLKDPEGDPLQLEDSLAPTIPESVASEHRPRRVRFSVDGSGQDDTMAGCSMRSYRPVPVLACFGQ